MCIRDRYSQPVCLAWLFLSRPPVARWTTSRMLPVARRMPGRRRKNKNIPTLKRLSLSFTAGLLTPLSAAPRLLPCRCACAYTPSRPPPAAKNKPIEWNENETKKRTKQTILKNTFTFIKRIYKKHPLLYKKHPTTKTRKKNAHEQHEQHKLTQFTKNTHTRETQLNYPQTS